jgi:hypothetical protein
MWMAFGLQPHRSQTFKLSGEVQTWALTFEGDKVKVHSEKYRRL